MRSALELNSHAALQKFAAKTRAYLAVIFAIWPEVRQGQIAADSTYAGGRRGKERGARHERSSDWRRGAVYPVARLAARSGQRPRPGGVSGRKLNLAEPSPGATGTHPRRRPLPETDTHRSGRCSPRP